MWIWEAAGWPGFDYDARRIGPLLADSASGIDHLHGRLAALESSERDRAALAALVDDVLESSAIEGERLDVGTVRSSLARRLGVDAGGVAKVDRQVEGVVAMTLDATENALRDLKSLVDAGVLEPAGAGGRSAAYWLKGMTGPHKE